MRNKLFYLLLFIFPLGELTRITLGNTGGVTLNDIGVGIVALFWFLNILIAHQYKKVLSHPFILPIAIFVGACILSLVLTIAKYELPQLLTASQYIVRWIAYTSLFFVVQDMSEKAKKRTIFFMTVSGLVVVLAGYVQYFFYPTLRNLYYAGWDEHLYRMFSSFLDPNFLGVFFVIFFLFSSGMTLITMQQKRQEKWLYILCSLMTFPAIFLTYSRSALVSLVVAVCVFLFLIGRKKIVALFIFVAVIFMFGSTLFFQSEGTNLLRTRSSLDRLTSLQQAVTIWQDHPIFGVGFNAYRFARQEYGFEKSNPAIPNHAGAGVDNSFLFVLVTTGIVGFLSYLGMHLLLVKQVYKQRIGRLEVLPSVALATLTALIISSMFINSLFYPFLMEWMWIVWGLTLRRKA